MLFKQKNATAALNSFNFKPWGLFSTLFIGCNLICCAFLRPSIVQEEEGQGAAAAFEESRLSSEERKERWERGQADYMGEDSFENIQKKLDAFLK